MKRRSDPRRLGVLCVIGALAVGLALAWRVSRRVPRGGPVSAPSTIAEQRPYRGAPPVMSRFRNPAALPDDRAPRTPQGREAFRRGMAAFEAGRNAEANRALEQVVRTDPDVPIARAYLGLLYVRQKRYSDALKQFQEEGRLLTNPAISWAHIADVYYAQGNIPTAIQSLEKAAKLQPDLAQVYFNLGMLYPQALELNKAVESLNRYSVLEPGNHYAHYLRGSLLYKLARLDEAEKALHEAIRREPRAGLYHFALAQVYFRRTPSPETNDLVLSELKQSLVPGGPDTAAPETAAVYYYMGLCYQRKGEWEAAREALTKSITLAPEAWGAYYALASVLNKLGHVEEARQANARFVQLRQEEDLRMQRTFHEQEVQRNPKRADVHYQLALFLMRHGERAAAIQALQRAQQCLTPEEVALRREIKQRMTEWRRGR
jgi:tetratricopeptide (TPR) repeat protein